MKSRESIIRPARCASVALSLLLFAAACGGSPTESSGEGDAAGAQEGNGEDVYAEVFDELDGLEGEERTDRLAELAAEEGQLSIYTSNTDLADMAEEFGEMYDIEVDVYRAQANTVLQRLLEEAQAGYPGADLYDSNAEEMATANQEGLLRDYDGPAAEGLVDAADQEGWVGSRLNLFTVAWNTDVVQDPPTSFEDLADERFSDLAIMEPRAFEWFMTMSNYLIDEHGMTQDEVDQMISDIASNSRLVEGHTEHAQFLASGEYGVSVSVYNHLVDELIDTGAPITREPVVEPIVVRPNGVGLLRGAQHPAAAVLFMEWVLTDAQQKLVEEFRIPAREDMQEGALDGVETITVDVEQLVAERNEWEQHYDELLRSSQGAVG